jgi:hypothetical protein
MARIHFLPPMSHTNPITATDRVPSEEPLGKPGMSVDRGKANTITRREILHRAAQRLKLIEQQSWQGIAQSKGMTYLQRLPEAIPEGQFLVHNSVRPTHPLGSHGFRAWLQAQDEHLEPCDCGWTPELGTHYRVKLKIPERDRAARATDFA